MQVTSTYLMNALNAEYSQSGSTKKVQETAVAAHFNPYVEETEDSREYLIISNRPVNAKIAIVKMSVYCLHVIVILI